jgi:Domain of unknown function (DUF4372)
MPPDRLTTYVLSNRYRSSWPGQAHGCPVGFGSTRRTTLIQIGSEGWATHLDTKGINAVRHKNSVFHDLLKLIPWASFDRLVEEHGSDALGRKFKLREQLIALLYGQVAGATSRRDIIAGLSRHQARLHHIGGKGSRALDLRRCQPRPQLRGLLRSLRAYARHGDARSQT